MGTSRTRARALLVAIAAAGVLMATASAASAASGGDTTPPVVHTVKKGAFVVGSQIETRDFSGGQGYFYSTNVQLRLSWSARDRSGICGYTLVEELAGGRNTLFEDQMLKRYVVNGTDYNGDFGGGAGVPEDWAVTAKDCAGNTSAAKRIPNSVHVLQDDNTSAAGAPGRITYTGSWSISNCSCWSATTTHKSFARGAAATFRASFARGDHVGLVMATGPDRGKAAIFVDGKFRRVVDTNAASKGFRVVRWQSRMPAGMHSVKLVNLATPGHPRIDLDAVLVDAALTD